MLIGISNKKSIENLTSPETHTVIPQISYLNYNNLTTIDKIFLT